MISLESKTVPANIGIHLIPTSKFKTVFVTIFVQQVLDRELATQTALLPAVLERGSRRYPTYQDIKRRLEELYGAELGAGVVKKGERHFVSFSLEVINDKFAPGENLLRQGMAVLRDVLIDPLLEDGAFKSDYVEQEKEQQEREILSLINNKVNYALERCIQEMCAGERFGVYRYGDVERLKSITPRRLYKYYSSLLEENAIDIFVVGEVNEEETLSLVEESFFLPRAREAKQMPPKDEPIIPQQVRYFEEKLPVNQGKLTLGYRTNVSYGDEDYLAMLFYNGILGGFPHSKLFQNVREKESLAYYAFSRLAKHKGIQLVGSGIEVKNYERALRIIQKQVQSLKKGEISHEEMENTRMALISQLKILGDNPSSLVSFFQDGLMAEREDEIEDMIRGIERLGKDDIVEAANKVALDTVYFLRSEDGKEGE
ncbi:MAG: EF-P 5-aminopentanol modification-associated protein YfmF [Dethiobacteria bacterium]